jgi:trans-aconitate 2-methyltransferase
MPWDPERYLKFQRERFAPFDDLIALVRVRPRLRVVDLGCGTGELTRRLADALPESEVTGIDSSTEMLARAAAQARPGLFFVQRSIEELDGEFDLIFSNAAIHWVEDHERLVPRLLSLVARGGQLALQLPSNHDHFAHTVILEVARELAEALGGWTRSSPVLGISRYAELLHASGGRDMTIFEKVYCHELPDADAVAEWTRGTTLVPYLERLSPSLREEFFERYRQRLRAHWPRGQVFYPFKRIFLSAFKAE